MIKIDAVQGNAGSFSMLQLPLKELANKRRFRRFFAFKEFETHPNLCAVGSTGVQRVLDRLPDQSIGKINLIIAELVTLGNLRLHE